MRNFVKVLLLGTILIGGNSFAQSAGDAWQHREDERRRAAAAAAAEQQKNPCGGLKCAKISGKVTDRGGDWPAMITRGDVPSDIYVRADGSVVDSQGFRIGYVDQYISHNWGSRDEIVIRRLDVSGNATMTIRSQSVYEAGLARDVTGYSMGKDAATYKARHVAAYNSQQEARRPAMDVADGTTTTATITVPGKADDAAPVKIAATTPNTVADYIGSAKDSQGKPVTIVGGGVYEGAPTANGLTQQGAQEVGRVTGFDAEGKPIIEFYDKSRKAASVTRDDEHTQDWQRHTAADAALDKAIESGALDGKNGGPEVETPYLDKDKNGEYVVRDADAERDAPAGTRPEPVATIKVGNAESKPSSSTSETPAKVAANDFAKQMYAALGGEGNLDEYKHLQGVYGLKLNDKGELVAASDEYGSAAQNYGFNKVFNDLRLKELDSGNPKQVASGIDVAGSRVRSLDGQANIVSALQDQLIEAGMAKQLTGGDEKAFREKYNTLDAIANARDDIKGRGYLGVDGIHDGMVADTSAAAQNYLAFAKGNSDNGVRYLQDQLIAAGMDEKTVREKYTSLDAIANARNDIKGKGVLGIDGVDDGQVERIAGYAGALKPADGAKDASTSDAMLNLAGNLLVDGGLDKKTVDGLVADGDAGSMLALAEQNHDWWDRNVGIGNDRTDEQDERIGQAIQILKDRQEMMEKDRETAIDALHLDNLGNAKAFQAERTRYAGDLLSGKVDGVLKGKNFSTDGIVGKAVLSGKTATEGINAALGKMGMDGKINTENFAKVKGDVANWVATNNSQEKLNAAKAKLIAMGYTDAASAKSFSELDSIAATELGKKDWVDRNFTSGDNELQDFRDSIAPNVAGEQLNNDLQKMDSSAALTALDEAGEGVGKGNAAVAGAEGAAGKKADSPDANAVQPSDKLIGANLWDPIRIALEILTPMLAEDHLALRDNINIKAGDIGPAVGAVDSTALGTDQGEDASRATTVVAGAQMVIQLLQAATVDLSLLSDEVKFDEEKEEEKPETPTYTNAGSTAVTTKKTQQESYRNEVDDSSDEDDEDAEAKKKAEEEEAKRKAEEEAKKKIDEATKKEIERRRAELMKQYVNGAIQIAEGMNAISSDFAARADVLSKASEGIQTESAGFGLAQDVGRYVLFETLRGLALSSVQMGVQASRLLFEQEVGDAE